jgi:serralysin
MLSESSPVRSSDAAFDAIPQASAGVGADAPQATTYLNADSRTGVGDNGKTSFAIDQAVVQLTRESSGWGGGGGQAATVTYAYRADAPAGMPSDTAGFSQFSPAQIVQSELAIKAWSDVANITFQRVGTGSGTNGADAYSDNATILLGDYSSGESGASAFTYFPGSRAASSNAGDVWVNSTLSYNADPVVQGYGGMVLVHELGHAIGLSHPSNYDAAAGVTLTYDTDASYFEDSRQYTVMSYFGGFNTGADLPGYSAAPLLDDIAAVQSLYGPNMATRTGDTVYGFNSNTDEPWLQTSSEDNKLQVAIWDAGGNDTLDVSGYIENQKIDLRQGFFSDVGGQVGNVAIARGTDIENAVSGTGADSITGNGLNNSLAGGGGDDTIMGGQGNDTISDPSGTHYLRGGDGDDSILGGSGFDDINGNAGADTIDGASGGDDWLVGGKDNDLIIAHAGQNILYGNLGADTLIAGSGGDLLRGGQGDDSIAGGAGNDWISGDRGNDTLSGGAGADTFHSFSGAGIDRVLDFNPGEGDRVQLDAGTAYSVNQVGADTVIDMGGGDQLVLVGVQKAALSGGWIFTA